MRRALEYSAFAVLLTVAACASGSTTASMSSTPSLDGAGPGSDVLVVPHFAADDSRVGTAGFVGETTRVNTMVDGTTYTLMIFAVGEALTLGAMVEGEFSGRAVWTVAGRRFSVPLDRSNRGHSDIEVDGLPLRGDHGGFDEYDWVNVDLPLAEWLDEGTAVRLEFEGHTASVVLPGPSRAFAATLVSR